MALITDIGSRIQENTKFLHSLQTANNTSTVLAYEGLKSIHIGLNIFIHLYSTIQLRRSVWVKPKSGEWWDLIVPQMSSADFKEHFRMTRETFNFIVDELDSALKKKDTRFRPSIPVRKRVGLGIHHLASCEEYRVVAALFGVGKSTACKIVNSFCKAVCKHLLTKFIKFPSTLKELKETADQFEQALGYPMCVGAIDGSHIPITPKKKRSTRLL